MVGTQTTEQALLHRVAENIGKRRRALGLTQAQLAERLGVDTETLSRFERGKHSPTLKNLARLAGLLQTTVSDLLAEERQQPSDDSVIITAWLDVLSPDDRGFALTMLKQYCDYLGARTASGGREQSRVAVGVAPDVIRKALVCPLSELDQNIDTILALIGAGLRVTITGEKKQRVCVSADNAYVLYRLCPSVKAKVLVWFPGEEGFWDLQPALLSYWDEPPKKVPSIFAKKQKLTAKEEKAKKLDQVRKKIATVGSQDLKATIEQVDDSEADRAE